MVWGAAPAADCKASEEAEPEEEASNPPAEKPQASAPPAPAVPSADDFPTLGGGKPGAAAKPKAAAAWGKAAAAKPKAAAKPAPEAAQQVKGGAAVASVGAPQPSHQSSTQAGAQPAAPAAKAVAKAPMKATAKATAKASASPAAPVAPSPVLAADPAEDDTDKASPPEQAAAAAADEPREPVAATASDAVQEDGQKQVATEAEFPSLGDTSFPSLGGGPPRPAEKGPSARGAWGKAAAKAEVGAAASAARDEADPVASLAVAAVVEGKDAEPVVSSAPAMSTPGEVHKPTEPAPDLRAKAFPALGKSKARPAAPKVASKAPTPAAAPPAVEVEGKDTEPVASLAPAASTPAEIPKPAEPAPDLGAGTFPALGKSKARPAAPKAASKAPATAKAPAAAVEVEGKDAEPLVSSVPASSIPAEVPKPAEPAPDLGANTFPALGKSKARPAVPKTASRAPATTTAPAAAVEVGGKDAEPVASPALAASTSTPVEVPKPAEPAPDLGAETFPALGKSKARPAAPKAASKAAVPAATEATADPARDGASSTAASAAAVEVEGADADNAGYPAPAASMPAEVPKPAEPAPGLGADAFPALGKPKARATATKAATKAAAPTASGATADPPAAKASAPKAAQPSGTKAKAPERDEVAAPTPQESQPEDAEVKVCDLGAAVGGGALAPELSDSEATTTVGAESAAVTAAAAPECAQSQAKDAAPKEEAKPIFTEDNVQELFPDLGAKSSRNAAAAAKKAPAARGAWAKQGAWAKPLAPEKSGEQQAKVEEQQVGGDAATAEAAGASGVKEAERREEEEEEEAADMADDPFAMMSGMGNEEVYKVTLMDEREADQAPATEAQDADEDDEEFHDAESAAEAATATPKKASAAPAPEAKAGAAPAPETKAAPAAKKAPAARGAWGKQSAWAKPLALGKPGEQARPEEQQGGEGAAQESERQEEEEEEAADIAEDPFAMMSGMGNEEVYKVTLMDEQEAKQGLSTEAEVAQEPKAQAADDDDDEEFHDAESAAEAASACASARGTPSASDGVDTSTSMAGDAPSVDLSGPPLAAASARQLPRRAPAALGKWATPLLGGEGPKPKSKAAADRPAPKAAQQRAPASQPDAAAAEGPAPGPPADAGAEAAGAEAPEPAAEVAAEETAEPAQPPPDAPSPAAPASDAPLPAAQTSVEHQAAPTEAPAPVAAPAAPAEAAPAPAPAPAAAARELPRRAPKLQGAWAKQTAWSKPVELAAPATSEVAPDAAALDSAESKEPEEAGTPESAAAPAGAASSDGEPKPPVDQAQQPLEEEEEEAGDVDDDPFAMMSGMGEESVYKVTLLEESTEAVEEQSGEQPAKAGASPSPAEAAAPTPAQVAPRPATQAAPQPVAKAQPVARAVPAQQRAKPAVSAEEAERIITDAFANAPALGGVAKKPAARRAMGAWGKKADPAAEADSSAQLDEAAAAEEPAAAAAAPSEETSAAAAVPPEEQAAAEEAAPAEEPAAAAAATPAKEEPAPPAAEAAAPAAEEVAEAEEAEEEAELEEEKDGEASQAKAPTPAPAPASDPALEPGERCLEHHVPPHLGAGIEDIETADSSGAGLKGDAEQTDEDRSDEADSCFGSIASPEPPPERGAGAATVGAVDAEGAAAASSSAAASSAATPAPEAAPAVSLRPQLRPKGSKPSLLGGLGVSRPARPAISVAEMLKWREAALDAPPPDFAHCVAVVHEVPDTPIARSQSDRIVRQGSARDPRGLPQRTPKGNNLRKNSSRFEEEPVEQLSVSSSSWAAQQRNWHQERQDEDNSDAVITRRIRSVLNKLTLEKFGPLLEQLISCGISKQAHLEILMHEIMEKALTQHHFINMYTELCAFLHRWSEENEIGDTSTDRSASFKKILLNEVQSSFERNLKRPAHLAELTGEERDEAEIKYKTAMIGNIRFVGALLAKQMVASVVIFAITEELLANPLVPDALESLAAFLTTVGGLFDRPDWRYRDRLNEVFAKISALSKDASVPVRIRCLLSDVLDLREAGWKDQKMATKTIQGPMTIDEVQRKHAEEAGGSQGSTSRAPRSSAGGTWSAPPTPAGGQAGGGNRQRMFQHSTSSEWSAAGGRAAPKGGWQGGGGGGRDRDVRSNSKPSSQQTPERPSRTHPWGRRPHAEAEKSDKPDLGKVRNELRATVKELGMSHDISEALQRVRELRVPPEHQAAGLDHMLGQIFEEGSRDSRAACFKFVNRLFSDGVLLKAELQPGLEKFFTIRYKDLIQDVPSLPEMVQTEYLPVLEELVCLDLVNAEQQQLIVQAIAS